VEQVPVPTPGEGEYLIRVHSAGVNPADHKLRLSKPGWYPCSLPTIPGWDMAGVIEARGHAARRFQVGDEVYSYARRPSVGMNGCYAQYICINESYIALKPKNISLLDAGSVPLVALTSLQSLKKVGLKSGEVCVIHGASGGTGLFAIQIAKSFGAVVVAIASSKNHEFVRQYGADHAVDYKGDVVAEVLKLFPKGVNVLYDCFGGDFMQKAEPMMVAEGGRVVSIAFYGAAQYFKKATFTYVFVEPSAKDLELITQLMESGAVRTHVSNVFPLDQAVQASELCEKGGANGKIVLDTR